MKLRIDQPTKAETMKRTDEACLGCEEYLYDIRLKKYSYFVAGFRSEWNGREWINKSIENVPTICKRWLEQVVLGQSHEADQENP